MTQRLRNILLIAQTLLLEAWRRREIYAIVIITAVLLVGLRFVHFFDTEGLGKFYREVSLKAMNLTTGFTLILLAARQLPREFADRTIYPMLAKPVGRFEFLLGKYLGVLLAALFCYALFMTLFLVGSLSLRAPVHPMLFTQAIYLQVLSFMVLASLVFLLSMLLNADAAITLSAILFVASQVLMNLMSLIYDYVGTALERGVLIAFHFIVPQLTLFDMSAKVVHSIRTEFIDGTMHQEVIWGPIPWSTVAELTAYATAYITVYLAAAWFLFRRKPL